FPTSPRPTPFPYTTLFRSAAGPRQSSATAFRVSWRGSGSPLRSWQARRAPWLDRPGALGPCGAPRPSPGAASCRREDEPPRRRRPSPDRTERRRARTGRTSSSPFKATRLSRSEAGLVDVRPVAVSFEDDLAAVASKHDLNVAPADRLGVAAADGARSGLFHVHRRNRVDLDL